ncbi:hypothetical protein [Paenibacillus harenae]|uniref:hypothetical protein n=1 Tax=Paenibacillus harenae TaxID=306543 RepID=UPI00278FE865|nr:hypothetical protein [Paenibacillus harenae]MDQ0063318.1 hypothetical protein [Paenibacillus harenae]
MFTVLRFIKNVVLFVLTLLIGFFLMVKLAGYVVEPLYSKYKMIPVAEQIAYKLQAEMPIPPTHEYLKQFTENLVKAGVVSDSSDVALDYLQLAGSSNYTVYVDYYKLLPLSYHVRGKVQYDGEAKYHDVDVYVHSSDYVDSSELPASKSQQQELQEEQGLAADTESTGIREDASPDDPNASNSIQVKEKYTEAHTEASTDFEEDGDDDFRIISVYVGDKRIADFNNLDEAQEYAENQGFIDFKIVDLTEDWRKSVGFELPEFSVIVRDKYQASFFTQEEAVDYAKQFDHAEVFVPNTFLWSNIAVYLFVDDTFVRSYDSKAEGIKDASTMDKAKLIDQETGKVVWDNYPRECRTCESAISDQYE